MGCYCFRVVMSLLCDASFGYLLGVGVRYVLVLLLSGDEIEMCLKLIPPKGVSEHITLEMSQSEKRV